MDITKPVYTDDELIERLWDKEIIHDLMSRHTYCYSSDKRREELSDLWVRKAGNRKTASLGLNNGYYVGMDAIADYYVVQRTERLYEQLKPYSDAEKVEYSNLNLGHGVSNIHTLNTPLIYISDDGKTGKFLGYDCAQQTVGKPDGTVDSYFVFGLIFADLIKEDGEWKIWHLIMEHDHTIPVGTDYSEIPLYLKPGDDPIEREFGTPPVQKEVYDPFFGWEYLYQDMPTPYYSYEEDSGYGANSNMGLRYFEREGWARYE